MARVVGRPPFHAWASPFVARSAATQQTAQANAPPIICQSVLKPPLILPAAYRGGDRALQIVDQSQPATFRQYLRAELDVSRLNQVHKHLWLAGLPKGCRPLHQQISIGRDVVITEQADLHLVWHDDTIWIKPLPDFLMDFDIWQDHLCHDTQLHENASGFLLSYLWLICQRSDLNVAHAKGVIPLEISWNKWTTFAASVLSHLDYTSLTNINPRYIYGELRLPRLNIIYRLCSQKRDLTTIIRGYANRYHQSSTLLIRNFSWLLIVFVYITIVLTAMQVGLQTTQLRDNQSFNAASYGFTVFSIVAPLVGVAGMFAVLAGRVVFDFLYAMERRRQKVLAFPQEPKEPTVRNYMH